VADNIAVTPGTGTTIAADDIGAGVLAQRVKPVWGPDGTGNDVDTASGKPLPVQLRSSTGIDFVKAEDAASASGDFGVPVLVVQKASPADSAGTDLDYSPPQMSGGRLWASAQVYGDTASGATDAGNPVKTGGLAKTANPTAVTDGQRVASLFDKLGKQVVVGAIRDLKGMQSTTITSSTAETTIVTAVASTFLDLYGLVITNTSATVTKVTIKDSTAGTTRAVFEIPATDTRGFMLPVDSALPQAAVNTAWTATCGTSVASVEIAAYYVKNI